MFKEVSNQIDFPKVEKEILAFWEREGIYEKSLAQRKDGKPFVFFEGPPTANGLPHPGHCLTRAIKDLFPRFKTMTGHYVLRKGGWDTHGLPVEVEVCKELGIHTKEEIEKYGVEAFNRKCLESVFRYTKEWEDLTRRLGFWVNLEEAYVTYHQSYIESVWWSLKQLFDAGLLYQGHKIVWWWAQGGTALSAGEVGQGYREVDDPSVYVRFPLVADDRSRKFIADCGLRIADLGSIGVPPVRDESSAGVSRHRVTPDLTKRNRILRHWEMGGSTYFITFRLNEGAMSDTERSLVLAACRHWDSQRIILHAAVAMPDHVHLLCTPLEKSTGEWHSIADLMHSIKGFTAKQINNSRGTDGIVWQREYFDRIIRNESDFQEKWEYIVTNPKRRGLGEDYEWVWVENDAETEKNTHRRDADAPPSSPSISLLVWTTTPWTLPSNTFAAVHKDFEYAIVHDEESGERLIFAAALVDPIAKKAKKKAWTIERTIKGSELIGLRYTPPFRECFYDRPVKYPDPGTGIPISSEATYGEFTPGLKKRNESGNREFDYAVFRVVGAEFVTLDTGTGAVHEAPAFGEVDFDLWKNESLRFEVGIPLFCAVAPNGTFTDEVQKYKGRWVKDCDKDIIRDLKERGLLLHQEQYRHDYPFCWRAEEDPLIQYPRRSWFIRTTQFKDAMLANNERINWLPEHIKAGRFGKFLESNVDWSLSRERYWGTPLPIWVCESCGHMEAVDSYESLSSKSGVTGFEFWEKAKKQEPGLSEHLKVHKPYIDELKYDCPKCAATNPQSAIRNPQSKMRRVPEVIDCWYDSGAMPFAQWGFPHKNHEMFLSQFPADFISEALDQTRGWFYSLVAISTLLFGENGVARKNPQSAIRNPQYPLPFRNCIVLGLLMGEDGLKMSKSKKNYKEPTYIFEHEGADAMRWLFFSGQTPWTSIRFQESAIAEGQREFLIRLYNCYSFFVIYANIDKWTPENCGMRNAECGTGEHRRPAGVSELDRWILSELAQCSLTVFDRLNEYDNYNAAKALISFVDALSNWYVRRSRDRYWKSGMDADKQSAYATLYECLVSVSKLIAPFTPFIAESMYQNLARTVHSAAPESVHLCDYPVTETTRTIIESRIDKTLNEEIEIIRQVVSCGRAARATTKLRVRQPLPKMEIFHRRADLIRKHEDLIRDELNVKRVDLVAAGDIDQYVHYEVKPDFKKLGPKFGPLAPRIKAALASHKNVDGIVKQLEQTGSYTLAVEGQEAELSADELLVELHAREGWSAERIPGQGILVLDTHLTPELLDEGLARDLVNQVQQVRKNLNLRYEQRIDLAVLGDADIGRVVNAHATHIRNETLAQSLLNQPIRGAEPVQAEIEGHPTEIFVKPL